MTSTISPPGGRGVPDCLVSFVFSNLGLPSLQNLLSTGDASVDSWFREIHDPRAWRVYLATGFDFRENNRACFGSI